MRRKFLVRGEIDEPTVRKILDPILLGITRTTLKAEDGGAEDKGV